MNTDVLVLNAGSSSIKASLFALGAEEALEVRFHAEIEGIGIRPQAVLRSPDRAVVAEEHWPEGGGPRNHDEAMALLVRWLDDRQAGRKPAAVGHRVVHGGTRFREPVVLDWDVHSALQALIPLAPLHQPHNLKGIDAATKAYPDAVQVACFDTAFHQGHPWVADAYALPREMYGAGIRRYGFHGLSYAYIARAMRRLAPEVARGRMIVAHLGNGASLCAIRDGRSVDSTMGFTALDGLPMGTRCGQIDPGVLLYLLDQQAMTASTLTDLLYKQSGLLGLSGISSDMRDLLSSNQPAAGEAVDYFVYRVTCGFGALAAALGGVDGIVFTAGIGEKALAIRERVCRGLAWMGLELDDEANAKHGPRITTAASAVSAWVVPTDEERMIATHVVELLGPKLSITH